uniref:Ubiquitin carboxyl-terminal hydrolase n=1 Tax=Oreochromis niloticus TaxID=8128 RepID=A0A669F8E4_ORENI
MNGQCTNTSLANRYHGLMNQGSTCYLNSVLQVLFMTEDFREAVKKYSEQNPHSEFLDDDLKALFVDLQNYTAYTYKITKKLGIDKVNEQRNAAEYFERILRMTSPDASKIFHGQLANKTTCSEGHVETDRDAPFWHLPLSLVDSCGEDYSVEKGIGEFFKPSDFCGENQMYCEQCDDKVDATMTDVIKHHPDVLCLLLKRFEFNYIYMKYIKITCSVKVPYTLQIPENQIYELYAFVDHFGDMRGGHYSATIKIQEKHGDKWYRFDDTIVTEADYQPFQLDTTERFQTAYLLFYRKQKDTGIQESTEVSISEPPTISNEYDQSQDGKNKRKREDAEEKDTEDNPKAARLQEPERSPDTPCNVDPPDKELNKDNGTTGSDDLDQRHTDNNPDFKLDVSDTSAVCADLNRQCEMSKLVDYKPDKDEKAEDKQSEKKSHAEPPAVRENIYEHQEDKQTVEIYYNCSDTHAKEEKTKTDFQSDAKGKISADIPTAVMCCDTLQNKETVVGKENIIKDDQIHEHGYSDTLNMQEISVTNSNNDACVQREISDMEEDKTEIKGANKDDHSNFGENTAENVISAAKTQKDVDVEEEMKVKGYEGNTEQIQIREKSLQRPAGSETTEIQKENQDVGTNEKTKAESCQPKVSTEIKEITEGGRGSQKSGNVQITSVEKKQNSDGEHSGTKLKNTGIETVEKTSQGSSERHVKNNEGKTETKLQANNAIKPRGVKPNESSLPEHQKRRTKREEQKHNDTSYSTYNKSHELDDEEIEAAGSEYDETNETCGCNPFRNNKQRQHRKKIKKEKQKKTTGFFAQAKKKLKRPDQNLESD